MTAPRYRCVNGHRFDEDEGIAFEHPRRVDAMYCPECKVAATAPPHAALDVKSATVDDILDMLEEATLRGMAICDLPKPEPLIDAPLLDMDSLAMMFGPSGCGKSLVALDMAAIVATGGMWQGVKVKRCKVLYVAAENARQHGDRLDAWSHDIFGTKFDVSNLYFLPMPVNLFDATFSAAVVAYAERMGAEYIVIDTLARSSAGS